MHGTTVKMI